MDSYYLKNSSLSGSSAPKNCPKKLLEQCIPLCFPIGATEHTDSMMKCAMNCKRKTLESFQEFKDTYKSKLEDDGYVLSANSLKNDENPFKDMSINPRLESAKKNFTVHTASKVSAYQYM